MSLECDRDGSDDWTKTTNMAIGSYLTYTRLFNVTSALPSPMQIPTQY